MVKYTQTIRWQIANFLSVFDHLVKLALKGLIKQLDFCEKENSIDLISSATCFYPFIN